MNKPPEPVLDLKLPAGFQFSQSSLQDYVDCPRRFQLRYIQEFAWPAMQSEPALDNERFIQAGSLFHKLAHQAFVGVPVDLIHQSITDAELLGWWNNFQEFFNQTGLKPGPGFRAELGLSTPVHSFRLYAKYDLCISADDGALVIYDWKTTRHRPGRPWLAERLQTRVYPYVLLRAGAALRNGRAVEPRQVEMVYWFASFPDDPIRFPYSAAQFEQDHKYLTDLISEIAGLPADGFPLTAQEQRCAYCVYRSLCGRGEKAGLFGEAEEEMDEEPGEIQIDFDQIAEIEF